MSALQTGLYGSAMIAATLAIRALGRHRLPRLTFAILWDAAALRLLFPWAIPSACSFYALSGMANPAPDVAVASLPRVVVSPAPIASDVPPHPASVQGSLHVIWLIGMCITAAIFTVLYILWLRRFAASLPFASDTVAAWQESHPLRRRLRVRSSDQISAPVTYGIVRPVILLPKSAQKLDPQALCYVLTHEYVHICRFDAISKLIIIAAVCIHWFNPLVWIMYVLANRDMELGCDEAVIERCGDRKGYATLLLHMEKQRAALWPFCSSFSRNTLEERIRSIMKIKKYTIPTLVLAASLVAGVSTVFATSPPEHTTQVIEEATLTRAPAGTDYAASSLDTSIEFQPTEHAPSVEWWTAEEYEDWLEKEKVSLQSLLGTSAWTSSDGEFVWTQEKIDEAVAQYEETLQLIRSGYLVSRSVDGGDEVVLVQYDAEAPSLDEYAPYGLEENEGVLYYAGERVRYFEDAVELEPGARAERCSLYDPEGTASVRAVREAVYNEDGSFDPFGRLTSIDPIPESEARALIDAHVAAMTQITQTTVVADEVSPEAVSEDDAEETSALLEPYRQHGLTWNESDGVLHMFWHGRPVHTLFDSIREIWIANNMNGTDLPASAIDLEAVYSKEGKLKGLKESAVPHEYAHSTAVATAFEGDASISGSRTFEEILGAYEPLGLAFESVRDYRGSGYNLYLNGVPVNHFVDTDSHKTFTFDSFDKRPEGITAVVVYEGGKPVSISAS